MFVGVGLICLCVILPINLTGGEVNNLMATQVGAGGGGG